MSLQPPEVLNRIALLRAKMTEGTIQPEDLTEAIQLLRANRMKSSEAARASKSKAKSKSPPRSADELLGDI